MNAKGLTAAVVVAVSLSGCAAMNQQWRDDCEILGKDTLYSSKDGDTSRTKRVSTSCGSFDVEDALSVGQFNSWDLWQRLQVGETYDLKTGGYRAGFVGMFPRVLDVKGGVK